MYGPSQAVGWHTDDPATGITILNGHRIGVPAAEGKQFAQIRRTGYLYQDVRTAPGHIVLWSVQIRSRDNVSTVGDTTRIHFGATPVAGQGGTNSANGFAYANSADNWQWKTLYGWYQVPTGQQWTRVTLTSLSTDPTDQGDLVDGVRVTASNC
jgi:hypothetical protein